MVFFLARSWNGAARKNRTTRVVRARCQAQRYAGATIPVQPDEFIQTVRSAEFIGWGGRKKYLE